MAVGGSNARERTSPIDVPNLTFRIFIFKARSERLSLNISGIGFSTISITELNFPPDMENDGAYLGLVSKLRKQVKAKPILNSTGTTASLCSIAFSYEGFYKATDLPLLIKSETNLIMTLYCFKKSAVPHFSVLSRVDHACYVRNRNTCLSNICCYIATINNTIESKVWVE
jgi:hypothetical protein